MNSIGPFGLGTVGVGVGEGDAVAISLWGAATGVSGFLHEMIKSATSNMSTAVRIGINRSRVSTVTSGASTFRSLKVIVKS